VVTSYWRLLLSPSDPNRTSNKTYNVRRLILMCVRVIFVTGKSNEYYIFLWVSARACGSMRRRVGVCMCACSLTYPACKAHASCYMVICGLSGSTIFFRHHLTNGTIFCKTLLNIKSVSIYSTTSIWKISHSKKNLERYCHKGEKSSCKIPVILVGF
jgi:hypothetical protein